MAELNHIIFIRISKMISNKLACAVKRNSFSIPSRLSTVQKKQFKNMKLIFCVAFSLILVNFNVDVGAGAVS